MRYAQVELSVLHGDALEYHSDLLALKHAQKLYGVDLAVATAARIDSLALPQIGEELVVRRPIGVGAKNLLFVGTQSSPRFGYEEIRRFSQSALTAAAKLTPAVREICLTLHGVGFGLDEVEAFESEVAGVIEAIDTGRHPSDLRAITFIERDEGRARRMRRCLKSLISGTLLEERSQTPRRVDRVGYDSAKRSHAFVAMPYAEPFGDILNYGIAPSIRSVGLLCERMDELSFTGDVLEYMKEKIRTARLVVADLSDANPNVYLEVGYAWGRDVPCILLCNRSTPLEFDVQGHRCLFYGSIMELEKELTTELRRLFG